MALVNSKGTIIISGKDGKEFLKKMKNPDVEVMEKRDKFIDDARNKIDVKHSKGKTVIKIKAENSISCSRSMENSGEM